MTWHGFFTTLILSLLIVGVLCLWPTLNIFKPEYEVTADDRAGNAMLALIGAVLLIADGIIFILYSLFR